MFLQLSLLHDECLSQIKAFLVSSPLSSQSPLTDLKQTFPPSALIPAIVPRLICTSLRHLESTFPQTTDLLPFLLGHQYSSHFVKQNELILHESALDI